MGYEIFDYDPKQERTLDQATQRREREAGQAANIKKVFDANPNAKIFVFVGGSHGNKLPQEGKNQAMMGRHLMDLLGTDVLSIRQSVPQSKPVFDWPVRQAIEPALSGARATVFRNAGVGEKQNSKWLTEPGFDMVVFHPRMLEILGRGSWMTMQGYRKLHVVNIPPLSTRTLLRARALPVQPSGIAMDQVLVLPQESQAALFLPIGEYALYRESEAGDTENIGRATIK